MKEVLVMKEVLENLYSGIGKKIKILAYVFGVLGAVLVIAGIIAGIIVLVSGEEWLLGIFLGAGLGGGISTIVSSFFLYAFGQLTDDVHSLSENKDSSSAFEMPEL